MCKTQKIFSENLMSLEKRNNKSNNENAVINNLDDNSSSADIVDQASSHTEKQLK